MSEQNQRDTLARLRSAHRQQLTAIEQRMPDITRLMRNHRSETPADSKLIMSCVELISLEIAIRCLELSLADDQPQTACAQLETG